MVDHWAAARDHEARVRALSPPKPSSPNYRELLRPMVDSSVSHVCRSLESLQMRTSAELDSHPIGTLPAGTLVRIIKRTTLPSGIQRAAVAREGLREGALGWVTVGKVEDDSPGGSGSRFPSRRDALSSGRLISSHRRGGVPGEGGEDQLALFDGDGHGDAFANAPAGLEGGADGSGKGEEGEPSEAIASKKKKGAREQRLIPSTELEALIASYLERATAEEMRISDLNKPLAVRLGKKLLESQVKVPEIVTSWAKRGTEPISRMGFRQNVRKMVEDSSAKEVDALFQRLDDDGGGTLDLAELKSAMRRFRDASDRVVHETEQIHREAAQMRERAAQISKVLEATRASEQADMRLEQLRSRKSAGAKLGTILVSRNLKVSDLVNKWDPSGDGEVDKAEFRHHVLDIGLQAEAEEIDELFNSLDDDGGGTLDLSEIKAALKVLKEESEQADKEVTILRKTTVELSKLAKAAQVELKKSIKQDETEVAEREKRKVAEQEAREVAKTAALKARAEKLKARKATEEAEREAFEANVMARRQAHKLALEVELQRR